MLPTWPLNKLQHASATLSHQHIVRTFSQRAFFVGIFFLFLGVISFGYFFSAIPPVVIGIWLLLYAVSMQAFPPPKAFRIGDISGIIAFSLNSLILLYEIAMYTRASGQLPRALPGIFLLIIAFGFIHFTYKRTVQFAPPPIDKGEEAQFKASITALMKADYQSNENVIQLIINSTRIKGILERDAVVLATNRGQEVSVLAPRDFEMIPDLANPTRKETAIKVRMGQQWVMARTDNVSYKRYEKWKAA